MADSPHATYQEHMTRTTPGTGTGGNFRVSCTCGWSTRVASRSDRFAAETAFEHVKAAQPLPIRELFDRL
jgi:hypothetical protein